MPPATTIAVHLHFAGHEFAEIERWVASGMHAQSQQTGPTLEDTYATPGASSDTRATKYAEPTAA